MKLNILVPTIFFIIVGVSAVSVLFFINSVKASPTMWNQTYGSIEEEYARSLVETSDGGYALAGGTLLLKTDLYGNLEWSKRFVEGSANCLILTVDGGYALAGETSSLGEGAYDFWLSKTDLNGNQEWTQTYGAELTDGANCLVETDDGGYALVGKTASFGSGGYDFWLVKTDINGNVEWNKTYGGPETDIAHWLIVASDGGYIIAGETASFGAGASDFWLIKTDEYGTVEWNQTYGNEATQIADSLTATSDGGYALAGYTTATGDGSGDFWLVKTDSNGNMQWNQTYGNSTDWERAYSVIATSDGGYALAGHVSYSEIPISNDFWLVKTDEFGNLQWTQTYGIDEWGQRDWEIAYAVIETTDGGYALAGSKNNLFWLVKTDYQSIIPEFKLWLVFPIVVVITLFVLILKQKTGHDRSELFCN